MHTWTAANWLPNALTLQTKQTRLPQYPDFNGKPRQDATGSNTAWGDSSDIPTSPGQCRIYYQNVNGISPADKFQGAEEIGYSATQKGSDIVGMVETNLNWNQRRIKSPCFGALRKYWNVAAVNAASSAIGTESGRSYQPGGVAQLIGGPWVARITTQEQDNDRMGRFVRTTLSGKGGKKISIITAYQVCRSSIATVGVQTTYHQQWTMLRNKGDMSPDPRGAFRTKLSQTIRTLQAGGHEIILMGDFNEDIHERTSALGRALLRNLGLIDVHQAIHPDLASIIPATYNRGSTVIDYILTTPTILRFISRAGIDAFQMGLKESDHRSMFIDVDLTSMLGEPVHLSTAPLRSVHSTHPTIAPAFRQAVMGYCVEHRVFERCARLQKPKVKELEAIDSDFTRAFRHGEKQHGRFFKIPWSPKLMNARRAVRFWTLWLCERRTGRNLSVQRAALSSKDKRLRAFLDTNDMTYCCLQHQRNQARKHLKDIIINARKHREELLEERISLFASCNFVDKEKVAKRIKSTEATKASYSRIRQAMGTSHSGGLKYLLVPSEDVCRPWTAIYDPEDVTSRLLQRNKEHFGQAEGTPFTTTLLRNLFGWDSVTDAGDQVHDGTFRWEDLEVDEGTAAILKYLTETPPNQVIDVDLNACDLIEGFKNWREDTSTSPSNRHLSLYKAMIAFEPKSTDDKPAPQDSQVFYTAMATLMNSCRRRKHVLTRWTTVINSMLEKIPGSPRINKLRVIHLFEADLNLQLGIHWARRMMWSGYNSGRLGQEQWALPGRTSIDAVMLKQLTYSLSTLTRTTVGTFDNDAKACYDRIIISLAMLLSRSYGLPTDAIQLHARFLYKARYHLKTRLGVSEEYYSNFESTLHGTGQGSRASPSIWCIISCMIIELARYKSPGATAVDPFLKMNVKRWMDAFVDDTTKWVNFMIEELSEPDRNFLPDVVSALQQAARWWEKLLYSTGGKLELTKCLYYVMSWDFDEEGAPYLREPVDIQPPVTVPDRENGDVDCTISQYSCQKSHRTLGVQENPSLQYHDELSRLHGKSKEVSIKIRKQELAPSDVRRMYWSMFLPSLSYSLPTTSFTELELGSVQRQTLRHIVPKMGYNYSMPHAVLFGPASEGGVGLRHLYIEQGASKAMMLLRHLRHGGNLGKYFQICLHWYQLVAGIGYDSLRSPHLPLYYVPAPWIHSLRQFLAESGLTIHVRESLLQVYPRRQGDFAIMEAAVEYTSDVKTLEQINRVRLFLQVESFADLCHANGRYIQDSILLQVPSVNTRSTMLWPRQGPPGRRTMTVWRSFLRQYTRTPHSNQLRNALGPWTSTRHRTYPEYYDPDSACVVRPDSLESNASASYYQATTARRSLFVQAAVSFRDVGHSPSFIPLDHVSTRRATRPQANYHVPHSFSPAQTFIEFISQQPDWVQHLLQHQEETSLGVLIQLLLRPHKVQLYAAHDGGAVEKFGSFGWVLATDGAILWEGRGTALGYPMHSFRAEAYGRLAVLVFLNRYHEYLKIQYEDTREIQCEFVTDSASLLKRLETCRENNVDSAFRYQQGDFDIIDLILQEEQVFPIRFGNKWVKSHQDKPADKKNHQELLNEHADGLATKALSEFMREFPDTLPMVTLPTSNAYLVDRGRIQTSRECLLLRTSLPSHRLRLYQEQRWGLTSLAYDLVDWTSFRRARGSISSAEFVFVTKFTVDWLPTGTRLHKYGSTFDSCPLCRQPEHPDHLFLCPHRATWRADFLHRLEDHLVKHRTDYRLRRHIVTGISEWLSQQLHPTKDPSTEPTLTWRLFIRGCIPSGWTYAQDRYYKTLNLCANGPSRSTGTQWTTKIIVFFWQQARQLWLQRNSELHTETTTPESLLRQELLSQIKALYSSRPLLNSIDRRLLDRPIEDIGSQTVASQQHWIHRIRPLIQQGIQTSISQARSNTRDIRAFFSPPVLDPSAPT